MNKPLSKIEQLNSSNVIPCNALGRKAFDRMSFARRKSLVMVNVRGRGLSSLNLLSFSKSLLYLNDILFVKLNQFLG